MSQDNNHDEWLSLIEISGPFLAVPVLKKAFPQGLEAVDGRVRKYLRQAYDEWCEARDNDDPQLEELHRAWIREVLARGLEYDEKDSGELLKRGEAIPATLRIALPEHGVTLSPDYALVNAQKALLLIQTYPADTDLDAAISQQGWVATPAERMVQLCRTTGCRLGLVTNGERWMLIDAPVGSVVTYASWYARLWGQEPLTLQAFLTLLGIRRFFVDVSEQLPALFDESLQHQEEVTDALGEQVRRAVEVLIQSLDKEDLNSARTLLRDVAPTQLYEAGLTIMMRLVFLLSAEERGLLLMGDEAYESNYAISTLRMQLRKESDEVLERRHDAWARLLATFRAVFGGIEHETLRLPALGGSLFDPDRFPFLEGRPTGSSWRTDDARPLPIDNRTVLLLLEAIQQYQGRTLSYRALDVEQIGYVYEGLLERTVKRTDAVTVELVGGKGAKKTIHALSELEALRGRDEDEFVRQLASSDALKRSASAIRKDLVRVVDASLINHLLTACHGDEAVRNRLLPIANLLRTDPWGYPLVYAKDAFIVTTGSDRRETGTHYTPKSLTEAIVAETLTAVAYVGPAEGTPRKQWILKSPAELLDLNICDPAMGSGAFLVQACRWLSDRLVESWSHVETLGKSVSVDGEVLDAGASKETLPRDSEARIVIARRLIAERCLYGVDSNPLAVELAKLSIWLVTLAKGRPFGFLDHNLRCGDSLLGIHRLDQLTELSMKPGGKGQQRLFGKNIEKAVHEAIELRQRLRSMPIRDIHDVEAMARLDVESRRCLEVPERIADAFIGEVFRSSGNSATIANSIASLAIIVGQAIDGDMDAIESVSRRAATSLATGSSIDKSRRRPFHWPLEFPEVFQIKGGFDSIVGNPPYLWGMRVSTALGDNYLKYLETLASSTLGAADLCVHFLLRSAVVSSPTATFGLVLVDTISQGDTREVGLAKIISEETKIIWSKPNLKWPGAASVKISPLVIKKGGWESTCNLNGEFVETINSRLSAQIEERPPHSLKVNQGLSFVGHYLMGAGFSLSEQERSELLRLEPVAQEVIADYLRGEDINQRPIQKASTFAINFSGLDLEFCENRYPKAVERIRALVKPQRDVQKRKANRERWWLYAEQRPGLTSAIANLEQVIVQPSPSKYLSFTFVSARMVFASPMVVVASSEIGVLGVLHSGIHDAWARKYSSTMGDTLRYTSSDSFDTFPFPPITEEIRAVSEGFYQLRQLLMRDLNVGVTTLLNMMNNRDESSPQILLLRAKYCELNSAVIDAYGWSDLQISYDFRDGGLGSRYSVSECAQRQILQRLLELNYHLHEEISKDLHISAPTKNAGRTNRTQVNKSIQGGFDFGDLEISDSGRALAPRDALLSHLGSQTGWHVKSDILAATGISDGQWNGAINELTAEGKIERQGERRGARYRFIGEAD